MFGIFMTSDEGYFVVVTPVVVQVLREDSLVFTKISIVNSSLVCFIVPVQPDTDFKELFKDV